MSLVGKVALVCNASSSLGYAIARRIGNAGAKVFLSDPDKTGLKFAVDGLKGAEIDASGLVIDLSVAKERTQLFEIIKNESGRLDVAVLGHKPNLVTGSMIKNSAKDFDQVFSKYLTIPFLTCKSAVPLLEKSGSSSIILISSIAGYTPFVDIGLFSAAQTGVFGLCKALASDLAKRNIRVNSVCLGVFDDDGSGAVWSSCSGAPINSSTKNQADSLKLHIASFIPLGRTGRGNDCAGLVEFLASDRASYITGENIPVSGGIALKI